MTHSAHCVEPADIDPHITTSGWSHLLSTPELDGPLLSAPISIDRTDMALFDDHRRDYECCRGVGGYMLNSELTTTPQLRARAVAHVLVHYGEFTATTMPLICARTSLWIHLGGPEPESIDLCHHRGHGGWRRFTVHRHHHDDDDVTRVAGVRCLCKEASLVYGLMDVCYRRACGDEVDAPTLMRELYDRALEKGVCVRQLRRVCERSCTRLGERHTRQFLIQMRALAERGAAS